MTELSPHFRRAEFACSDGCGFDTVDAELLTVLERVRRYFDAPVVITSGCRCVAHNADIGGAENSQHVLGRAADIQVEGVDPEQVVRYLEQLYPHRLGIGLYPTWTHVDTRNGVARWNG